MKKRLLILTLHATTLLLALGLVAGCSSKTGAAEAALAGRPTTYEAPGDASPEGGIGVESQDVISLADAMVRDLLATPQIANRDPAPRIIIDAQHFANESTSRINKNMITDRIRNECNRASKGKILFVGREYAAMVEKERDLKREGVVDGATLKPVEKTAGADYRMVGRLTSLDSTNPRTGRASRFTQFNFEMIDLESGIIVWTNSYDFRKGGSDDVIYR